MYSIFFNTMDIHRQELNDLFKKNDTRDLEVSVSQVLKEIYSGWFFYEYDFNNPLTRVTCRKLDDILPKDDGGGNVQFKLY
jgi:hypothetical protein